MVGGLRFDPWMSASPGDPTLGDSMDATIRPLVAAQTWYSLSRRVKTCEELPGLDGLLVRRGNQKVGGLWAPAVKAERRDAKVVPFTDLQTIGSPSVM